MAAEHMGGPGLRPRLGAFACAVAVFLIVGLTSALAAIVILRHATDHAAAAVSAEASAAAQAVGVTLRDQLDLAIGYGIPLDELPGIAEVFEDALAQVPGVVGIRLETPGRQVEAGRPGAAPPLSLPVGAEHAEGAAGALHVWSDDAAAAGALAPLWGFAALAVLLSAAAAGMGAWLVARQRLVGAAVALDRLLREMAGGTFREVPPRLPAGRAGDLLRAVRRMTEPLRARHREVHALAEELREIDYDGSLTRESEAVVAPVEARWRFPRASPATLAAAADPGPVPWTAPALAALAIAAWCLPWLGSALGAAAAPTLALGGVTLPAALLELAVAAVILAAIAWRGRPAGSVTPAMLCLLSGLVIAAVPWWGQDGSALRLVAAGLVAAAVAATLRPVPGVRAAALPIVAAVTLGPGLAALMAAMGRSGPSDAIGTTAIGAAIVLLSIPAMRLRPPPRAALRRRAGPAGVAIGTAGAVAAGLAVALWPSAPWPVTTPEGFAAFGALAGLGAALALGRVRPGWWAAIATALALGLLHLALAASAEGGWGAGLAWAAAALAAGAAPAASAALRAAPGAAGAAGMLAGGALGVAIGAGLAGEGLPPTLTAAIICTVLLLAAALLARFTRRRVRGERG